MIQKPSMLQSMGSQRVRHNFMTEQQWTPWYATLEEVWLIKAHKFLPKSRSRYYITEICCWEDVTYLLITPWKSQNWISLAETGYILTFMAQMVKNLPAVQEIWFQSLGGEDPLEKGMATHSSILAGEFHGQRSLVGYSPRGRKELDMTERLLLLL